MFPGVRRSHCSRSNLKNQWRTDIEKHKSASEMQVVAEIHLGRRTVLEYLLSPVQKTVNEAGRER